MLGDFEGLFFVLQLAFFRIVFAFVEVKLNKLIPKKTFKTTRGKVVFHLCAIT